ncbi:hypothetical protein [Singulisphaera acidiphila]|uniref:hypothetical protein n=1 Tax=Singulisphaera acidiphila TaxID=466153 RepID=UPI000301DEC0|nr:hypothetical protein [Singulisphaera acidiphila]
MDRFHVPGGEDMKLAVGWDPRADLMRSRFANAEAMVSKVLRFYKRIGMIR